MAGKTRSSSFGTVEKRAQQSGVKYAAIFQNPRYGEDPREKRRISKTFERKTVASAWLAQQQAAIERGEWLSPVQEADRAKIQAESTKRDNYTFGQYAETYLKFAQLRPSTRRKDEINLKIHLLPRWQNTPIKQITAEDITDWITAELGWRTLKTGERKLYSSARKHAFELFRAILNAAVIDGRIPFNPCNRRHATLVNKVVNSQRHEPRVLEPSEVEAIANEVPENLRMLVRLLAATGVRIGEARELRRKDIDLATGTISITRAIADNGIHAHVGAPKTKSGIRTVTITDPRLLRQLREHLATLPVTGMDALVFPAPSDPRKHRDEAAIRKVIQNAAKRLGLPPTSPHDFRHTALTLAARTEGVSIADVQAFAGHSTPIMTLRYMETNREQQNKLAASIAKQLAQGATQAQVVDLDQVRNGTGSR